MGAGLGGWCVLLLPLYGWWLFTLLDALTGLNEANADPETPEAGLYWYRLITLVWLPIQIAAVLLRARLVCAARRAPVAGRDAAAVLRGGRHLGHRRHQLRA